MSEEFNRRGLVYRDGSRKMGVIYTERTGDFVAVAFREVKEEDELVYPVFSLQEASDLPLTDFVLFQNISADRNTFGVGQIVTLDEALCGKREGLGEVMVVYTEEIFYPNEESENESAGYNVYFTDNLVAPTDLESIDELQDWFLRSDSWVKLSTYWGAKESPYKVGDIVPEQKAYHNG